MGSSSVIMAVNFAVAIGRGLLCPEPLI